MTKSLVWNFRNNFDFFLPKWKDSNGFKLIIRAAKILYVLHYQNRKRIPNLTRDPSHKDVLNAVKIPLHVDYLLHFTNE